MNIDTLARIRKIDSIIRRIRTIQREVFSPYTDYAIENLKLVKLQIAIDGDNRDKLEAERQFKEPPHA